MQQDSHLSDVDIVRALSSVYTTDDVREAQLLPPSAGICEAYRVAALTSFASTLRWVQAQQSEKDGDLFLKYLKAARIKGKQLLIGAWMSTLNDRYSSDISSFSKHFSKTTSTGH